MDQTSVGGGHSPIFVFFIKYVFFFFFGDIFISVSSSTRSLFRLFIHFFFFKFSFIKYVRKKNKKCRDLYAASTCNNA